MSAVNMHDAKTQFSRLVDRAAAGETIIVAKARTPVEGLVFLTGDSRVADYGSLVQLV